MTTSLTPAQRLTVVKHLASGKGLDVVATITKIPRDVVVDIGSHHGYPDRDKLAWAADILEKKIDEAATAAIPTSIVPPERIVQAPASAPAPVPLTRPDEIRILLNTAKTHPSKFVQNAAEKVFADLDRLKARMREYDEKHAAARQAEAVKAAQRAEVERLERQLAEAKARLRGKPAEPPVVQSRAEAHACNRGDCERTFETIQALRMHQRRAHEGFDPNKARNS